MLLARRSRAREVALQLLFQKDQNPKPVPRRAIQAFARDRLLKDATATDFCLSVYDGVLKHLEDIDKILTATAENWRLSRMHPSDRNVLRLATYEMAFATDKTPAAVAIDESIELARRFGSADSGGFVNGVLDKIARNRAKPEVVPVPAVVEAVVAPATEVAVSVEPPVAYAPGAPSEPPVAYAPGSPQNPDV